MQNQNQQQIFITRNEFLAVEEVQGGYVLVMRREYNTGAIDERSLSPAIPKAEFKNTIEGVVKSIKDGVTRLQENVARMQEELVGEEKHGQQQVELLNSFLKPKVEPLRIVEDK